MRHSYWSPASRDTRLVDPHRERSARRAAAPSSALPAAALPTAALPATTLPTAALPATAHDPPPVDEGRVDAAECNLQARTIHDARM